MAGGKKKRSKKDKKPAAVASTCQHSNDLLAKTSHEEDCSSDVIRGINQASSEIERKMARKHQGRVHQDLHLVYGPNHQELRGSDLLQYASSHGTGSAHYWSTLAPLWELSRSNNRRLNFLRDWIRDEKLWLGLSAKGPKLTLLDLACGTGVATRALAPFVKAALGVDAAEGMLILYEKTCAEAGIADVKTLQADWRQLFHHEEAFHERSQQLRKEADAVGKYDVAVACLGVSFFLSDTASVKQAENFLKVLASRLNPGGLMIILDRITKTDTLIQEGLFEVMGKLGSGPSTATAPGSTGVKFLTQVLKKAGYADVDSKFKANTAHPEEAVVNEVDLGMIMSCYGAYYMLKARVPDGFKPPECEHNGLKVSAMNAREHSGRDEIEEEEMSRLGDIVHAYHHTDLSVKDLVCAVHNAIQKDALIDNMSHHPAMLTNLSKVTSFAREELLYLLNQSYLRGNYMQDARQFLEKLDDLRECFRGRLSLRPRYERHRFMPIQPLAFSPGSAPAEFWRYMHMAGMMESRHPLAVNFCAENKSGDMVNPLLSLILVYDILELHIDVLRQEIMKGPATKAGYLYAVIPVSHGALILHLARRSGLPRAEIRQKLRDGLAVGMGILEAIHEVVHTDVDKCFCDEGGRVAFARTRGEITKIIHPRCLMTLFPC